MDTTTMRFKIRRQDGSDKPGYWQTFDVTMTEGMCVTDVLIAIQRQPMTVDEERATPVVWERCSHVDGCAACMMVINGKVLAACDTPVDVLEEPVVLEPLSRFPVVRDLWVDRGSLRASYQASVCWSPVDTAYDYLEPQYSASLQAELAELSRCNHCGACLEACPQVNAHTGYRGAAVMARVLFFHSHPIGKYAMDARLPTIMEKGGIASCGWARNCQVVCPQGIPLTDALARLGRLVRLHK